MPEVKRIVNNLLATNTYVYLLAGKKCLVIDPGSDYNALQTFLNTEGLTPVAILATHGHFDHVAGVVQLQKEYPGCRFYLHKRDIKTMKLSNFMMKMFSLKGKIEIPQADITFDDATEFDFDIEEEKVKFIHTPGHTLGSCVIKIGNDLFSGDTLFYSHVSSKIPNDSAKLLAESQKFILDTFDDELMMLPGHGDSSLLKNVKNKVQSSLNN